MEGLKLIDLGNEVNYIEIDTRKVPYNFSVKLQDKSRSTTKTQTHILAPSAKPWRRRCRSLPTKVSS